MASPISDVISDVSIVALYISDVMFYHSNITNNGIHEWHFSGNFLMCFQTDILKITCEQMILIQFYHAQVSLVQTYIHRLGYLGNENLLILILISLA